MVTLTKSGYKTPNRINRVSITMFLMFSLTCYVGYSFWPVLALRANVGALLDDYLAQVYRANMAGEPDRSARFTAIKTEIIKKVKAMPGMRDLKFNIDVKGDRIDDKKKGDKWVTIRADFKAWVVFEGIGKRYLIPMSTESRTGAARVDWD